MKLRILTAIFALFSFPIMAQSVSDCDDWKANIQNVAEPWEDSTRTFANGAVRIVLIDTVEPANAAFHLLILSPPFDEAGERQCRIVSAESGLGFYELSLSGLSADYHPELGLQIELPIRVYGESVPELAFGALMVNINQSTGQITAEAIGS